MEDRTPACTPLPSVLDLSMRDGDKLLDSAMPYQQLAGCILHLSNTMRPDLAFASSYLSRFMCYPTTALWKAAKHLLRYLKGTPNLGIVYTVQPAQEIM